MDFKTGKLHKVIREFQKGNGSYEINGIDLKNTIFLYREKASPFIPIPKGNYRTVFNDNESTLIVDEIINNKAIEFQVISVFDIQASKYLEKFPELKMLVEHTNKIVDDINNIIEYLNSVGIKSDSKFQTQILTPLEPSSTWYMNADGIIDTLPIDDFNKKFKEIIEKISETVDVKAREQVKKKLETLKTEIETFKNRKIIEITDSIKTEKDTSLKAIEELLKTSKVELNEVAAIISNNSSEALSIISTQKDNSIREITEVKNNSKRELDSKMPEINNRFNGITGGQLNPNFIQDTGEKREGQFYLDRNTGRLHKCIKPTSSTINSAEFFKDYSLEAIIKNLESLTETGSNANGAWFKDKRTGLIIQWGFRNIAVTKNDYEEHIVDLPIPFTNNFYCTTIARTYNYHNISEGKWSCIPFTDNKIKILTSGYTHGFGQVDGYIWIAIGR